MKKILRLVCLATLLALLMPISVLGLSFGGGQTSSPGTKPEDVDGSAAEPAAGYDAGSSVTVLIDGTVQTLTLEQYLVGVVAAEMPASFPEEALKAQAVAARTYTLYKENLYGADGSKAPEVHKGAVMCADSAHCKAYCDASARAQELWGDNGAFYLDKITKAVKDTDGLIVVYEGTPIAAVFHAASAQRTEAAVDVWGNSVPYLVSVDSPGGDASSKYHATVELLQTDFSAAFTAAYPKAELSGPAGEWFQKLERSEAGGVTSVEVGGVAVEGKVIRSLAGLNSTNFTVEATENSLVFTTTGYGHGVGMSQYGARAMALEGSSFEEILKHYYSGTELLLKTLPPE